MAKESGLGITTLSVDDSGGNVRAIKNDINSFEISTPREVQEVTGVDKSAIERIHLLADLSITLNGAAFNDETNFSHDVFKVLDNARTTTLVHSGQTLAAEVLYTDYALSRGDDGSLTWEAPGVLANGTVPTWA
jgi:hypothetical protein